MTKNDKFEKRALKPKSNTEYFQENIVLQSTAHLT